MRRAPAEETQILQLITREDNMEWNRMAKSQALRRYVKEKVPDVCFADH